MVKGPWHALFCELNRAVQRPEAVGRTDAQLLHDFASRRDETAFELLVWRHATMVLHVCRRLLHDRQEAEDALQTTFLVLARKAGSIRQGAALAGWLHRVATRLALRVKARAARRPRCQALDEDVPGRPGGDHLLWADLRPVLDEEVNRLPEKYRQPVILCYLEGHSNEEAARQLGCPRGTILSRLARGRERLRGRLMRRGITLSAGALGALLGRQATAAPLPATLVVPTAKAALSFVMGTAAAGLVPARVAAWTEGVLHAMFLSKVKTVAAVVLVLAVLGTGAGLMGDRLHAQRTPRAAAAQPAGRERRADGASGRDIRSPELRGTLKAVDTAKHTITVAVGEGRGPGVDRVFALALDVEVGSGSTLGREIAVKESKLADLAPGALVGLQLSADGAKVESILAQGPRLQGRVKVVNPDKNTLTVTLGASRGREELTEEKTFVVAADARVGLDDGRGLRLSLRPGKLGDLAPDAPVTLEMAPDLKTVVGIQATGMRVQGIVKAVDPAKDSITVAVNAGRGRDEAVEERTYSVARNAEIALDDGSGRGFSLREGKLADLAVGAHVGLQLAADQNIVGSVVAEGPPLFGVLKDLDLEKYTITVSRRLGRGEDGAEDQTVPVRRQALVLIDDGRGRRFSIKEGKLADLAVGAMVQAKLSVDGKTVNLLRAAGPMIPGRIKALDVGKRIITLTTRVGRGDDAGEEKTLNLAPDVRVTIDGAAARLADVKAGEEGAFAALRLSLDQKVVRSITVNHSSR